MDPWKVFLLLSLLCICTQSFFAMIEMAGVSFNKVRLQYYISQNSKRALWLHYLLKHPALFFGTILIVVNASLLIGSECSRNFYESMGLSVFWAPITQAFLVLVFAEIAPMFAGRRYSEHAVMIGIPIVYGVALLLRPFIWIIDWICKGVNRLCGASFSSELYLSREELQNVIEEREETLVSEESDEFDSVLSSIFALKSKTAKELMIPLRSVQTLPIRSSVRDLKDLLKQSYTPFVPLYHKNPSNIVSIVYPRDLLRVAEEKKLRDCGKFPWFITESTSILQILKQFRKNSQSVSVILNQSGVPCGILTLDEVIDDLFQTLDVDVSVREIVPKTQQIVLDKEFPSDMPLKEFEKQYKIPFGYKNAKTLGQAMELALGHAPREGESVKIDPFELTAEQTSLLGPKVISVKTLS